MAFNPTGANPWLKYNRAAEAGELPQPPQDKNYPVKLAYPDWWPAMREFAAPPTEGQPYWTPRRIGRYYNALQSVPYAANVPSWIDVPKIETAYKMLSDTRASDWQTWEDNLDIDPGLKAFVSDWAPPPLAAIPQWEQEDLAAVSDALKTDTGPIGEWTQYGIDYETWNKLPEWKKWANKIFRSMYGQMGQQAVNLGVGGAFAAGVPGFVAGASAGALMGYLGTKENERAMEMGENYKPGATFYVMGALNFLFTQAQQGMAFRQQIQNALVDPEQYGSVADIFKDIPAAWEAGEGFYSLLPYEVGSAFGKDGKVRVINIAGEDTFIEGAGKGVMGSGVALAEIRRMLSDGKLSPEQVREYTIQRYGGFAGEMTDLLAGFALDPLDLIGPVTGGIIGNVADKTGNVPLAKSLLAPTGQGELLSGYRRYRQELRQMPVDDLRKMSNVTQWFAGIDKSGQDVTLRQTQRGFVDKMFGATPQARAEESLHQFVDGASTLLDMEQGNVDGMYRIVNALTGTPGKAVDAVANSKAKINVGGVLTGVDMPRWILSAEAQVVPLMLKDQMPKVKDHYDLYRNTRPQANLLTRMSEALGEDVYRTIADLHSGKADYDGIMKRIAALANEGNKAAADFMKNMEGVKDLNNAALKKAADLFSGESGAAFDGKMWGVQLMHILSEGAEKWAVDWFGIKPSGWAIRFGEVIKKAQSQMLLGLNPSYLANNTINNIVTLAWDGLFNSMSRKQQKQWLRSFGITTQLRKGMGGAEIGEMDTGVIPGTETGKAAYKLGKHLREATRAKDGIQQTLDLMRGGDKFMVAAALSQRVERFTSEIATFKGMYEYWNQYWRAGVGFDKMDSDLRMVLDTVQPGLADRVEKAIARGLNKTEIEKEVFTRLEVPRLRDVMTPEDMHMMSSFPGLMDEIDKGMRDATTNEERRVVFQKAIRGMEQKMLDDIHRKAVVFVHKSASSVQIGGYADVFDKLDTLVPERYETWDGHLQHMDDVAEQAESLTRLERDNLWREELLMADIEWRSFQDQEGTWWLGIFEGLGADRTSDTGILVEKSLWDQHNLWNAFYDLRRRLSEEYSSFLNDTDFTGMSKSEKSAVMAGERAKNGEELNKQYGEAIYVEDLYQGDLDKMFYKKYTQQFGVDAGVAAMKWRDEQRNVRRTMVQAMLLFRTGSIPEKILKNWGALLSKEIIDKIVLLNNAEPLYKIIGDERHKANQKFYREIYRPLLGEMMKAPVIEKPKPGKPKVEKSVVEKPAIKPKEPEQTTVWKYIAETRPEMAGIDENGRPVSGAKLNIIKWLRKWSQTARDNNIKKWAEVTPALIHEAAQAEDYFNAHKPEVVPVEEPAPVTETVTEAPVEPVQEVSTELVAPEIDTEAVEISDALAEEARFTDGLSPEAVAEVERAQQAAAAREQVIARAESMRQNVDEIMRLAPPKEVNGEIFREYIHQIMSDKYPDKPNHAANRADAVWTVIDRIATTLAAEKGISKDEWYSNFVLSRGGERIWGDNALYRTDPEQFYARLDRLEYTRTDDGIDYTLHFKNKESTGDFLTYEEARTVLGDDLTAQILAGEDADIITGADLRKIKPGGYSVRGASGATYWLDNGKAVMHAFSRADIADVMHEYIHAITPLLPDTDLRTIERWYAKEYGRELGADWMDKTYPDVDAFEKLARAFERYMTEGPTGFVGEIVQALENIKAWMLDIYKSLTNADIDIHMNSEIRGMFDRWLGQEPKQTTEPAPVEPAPSVWQKQAIQPATETPEFKAWFKDSKMVNENGKPMDLYHGTTRVFEEFDLGQAGTTTDEGWFGRGFYFTPDPVMASGFTATYAPNGETMSGPVMPVHLSIQKPFDFRHGKIPKGIEVEQGRYGIQPNVKQTTPGQFRDALIKEGYDGVLVYEDLVYDPAGASDELYNKVVQWYHDNRPGVPFERAWLDNSLKKGIRLDYAVDYYGEELANQMPKINKLVEVVAFYPEQIKSKFNRGTWSGGTGNILYRIPTDNEGGALNEPHAQNAPLGTADELMGVPTEEITMAGWNQHLRPALERAQNAMLSQTVGKIDLDESLTQEGRVALRNYLGRVYSQLADVKMGAKRWGESRRNAALLDYSKKTGIDNTILGIFPYQFWYTRTAINWALRVLNKPSIAANYYRLLRMSQRKEEKDGYPRRLKGKIAMPAPWLPDFMGDNIYIDPWKQALPILQMTRPFERAAEEKNQITRRTEQLIYDMVDSGEITDEQAQQAITDKGGAIYIKAKAKAESESERDFQNPFDFAFSLSAPLLPISIAYNVATGRADRISQLPLTRLVQNLTAMAGIGGPRGVNLESGIRKAAGLPTIDRFEDYRVDRELASMTAEGLVDADTATTAMIDRSGQVFEDAQRRVSQQGVIRYFGTALALDLFPEGEAKQRGLQDEFAAAYDAKAAGDKEAVNKFFDKYPEYSTRLMSFKEPEERMRAFLRGIVWDKYLALPKVQAKRFREAAGDVFAEAFLDSETRSYDSISTDTLAMWANSLGETPHKAGTAELPVDWMDDETAKQIDTYYNERTRIFGEYDPNAEPDPNYSLWQNQYLAQHPNIIQYVIGETNALYGLPQDIQVYVYRYRAERDLRYPNIFNLQDRYFTITNSSQKKAFMKANPELKEYWGWRKQMAANFPKAAAYIMSDESLAAEILDEDYVSYSGSSGGGGSSTSTGSGNYGTATYSDGRPAEGYHPPYLTSGELKRFSRPLVMQLLALFYRNEGLMPGANQEIMGIWEELGRPFGTLADFIEYAVKPTLTQ